MKKKIETILCSRYTPFVLLYLAMLILHAGMRLDISDDGNFGQVLAGTSLWNAMGNVYRTGSGKVLTDTAGIIFAYLPAIIWKVLDCFVYVVIAGMISWLFTENSICAKWITVLCVLLYPMQLLLSAGFCMTSTNYVWTTAAVLVALAPVKWCLNQTSAKAGMLVITLAASLYAGSQEQSAAILLGAYGLFLIWYLVCSICHPNQEALKVQLARVSAVLVHTAVVAAALIFMMTSPGHILKSVLTYNTVAVPNYPVLDFLDKIELGFTTTMAHYISQWNVLFAVFVVIIAAAVFQREKSWLYRGIALVPVGFYGILLLFGNRLEKYFRYLTSWSFDMVDFAPINSGNFTSVKAYVPIITAMVILGCILISFYVIYGNTKKTLLVLGMMAAGICSRVVMAFSYTLYGSDTRTFTYLYFVFILLSGILGVDIMKGRGKAAKGLVLAAMTFGAAWTYVGSLLSISIL